MKNTILVYKMTYNGGFLISANLYDIAATIENEIEDMDEGEEIVIERIEMSQKKYESLPDFDGF